MRESEPLKGSYMKHPVNITDSRAFLPLTNGRWWTVFVCMVYVRVWRGGMNMHSCIESCYYSLVQFSHFSLASPCRMQSRKSWKYFGILWCTIKNCPQGPALWHLRVKAVMTDKVDFKGSACFKQTNLNEMLLKDQRHSAYERLVSQFQWFSSKNAKYVLAQFVRCENLILFCHIW